MIIIKRTYVIAEDFPANNLCYAVYITVLVNDYYRKIIMLLL